MKLRLLAISLLFAAYYFFLPTSSFAQTTNNYPLSTNADVPQNLHTYTQSVFIEIAATLSCQIAGVNPIDPESKCLGIDPNTGKIGFTEDGGGAINVLSSLISKTFYIPVNTHEYGAYVASNFGIAKQTYAQESGIGFNGLLPTLKLWEAFRNITYLFFVVLFVIIGLGIMFRIKIDPRTVMSIQNQIPKIIIALILVTFSYAIAGFLIDLMYIVLYLSISIFVSVGVEPTNITASTPFGAIGGFGSISGISNGVATSIGGIVASMFDGSIGRILAGIIGGIIGNTLSGGSGIFGIVGTLGGAAIGVIGGKHVVGITAQVIVYLVVIVAIFSALLRLWFLLIKSYIFILLTTVFAPFYMAYGLLPGKSGFGSWMKSMVANLSVFPVTIIFMLLGKSFIDGFSHGNPGSPPFIPPMVGDWATPERFGAILGLGLILMLPEIGNMVRDTLKAPDFKYASAVGKGLNIGQRSVGAVVGKPYEKLMDRNKQTGKAQGWLAQKFLGKNMLTRTLFNTNDYRSPKQIAQSKAAAMMRGAARRRQQNASSGGNTPPTGGTPPHNPPPAGGGTTPGNGTPPNTPPGGTTPPTTGGTGTGTTQAPPTTPQTPSAPNATATTHTDSEVAPGAENTEETPPQELPHENTQQNTGGAGPENNNEDLQNEILKRLGELERMQREGNGDINSIQEQTVELQEKLRRLKENS